DIEEIHAGMLRPGRIDTIIPIREPDAEAVGRLIRHYGREIIDPRSDLKEVSTVLTGSNPAIVREAVERSKLSAITDAVEGQPLVINEGHLMVAAKQMLAHSELMREKAPPKPDLVILGEAIGQVIDAGMYARYGAGVDDAKEQAKLLLDEA